MHVNKIVASPAVLQNMHTVLFVRAYDSCLRTAHISRTDAAAAAGYERSVLSRLLNGQIPITPQHVERLVQALPDDSDRQHCIRAYLTDCCPETLREQLIVHFGITEEPKARTPDRLSAALATLEKAAAQQEELRRLLLYLASIQGDQAPPGDSRLAGGGPAHSLSKTA